MHDFFFIVQLGLDVPIQIVCYIPNLLDLRVGYIFNLLDDEVIGLGTLLGDL